GGNGGSGGNGGGASTSYTLTVTKSAANAGTVTSSPAGISCDTTCTTQTATFKSTTIVALAETPSSAMNATFGGWSGGGCSGTGSCSVTLSANTSITADFQVPITLPKAALGLFVVTIGGAGSTYIPVDGSGGGVTIDSTEYLYSMIIPSTNQWVVKTHYASESYAPAILAAFGQDDQVFQVTAYYTQCPFVTMYNPDNAPVTQFTLTQGFGSGSYSGLNGWQLNHIGIVGDNIYYMTPIVPNQLNPFESNGGQFEVTTAAKSESGGTMLLSASDPDNKATMDVADSGTLYAIIHDSTNGTLTVWTRDLTTGKLATELRNYDTLSDESLYASWSFAINDGIFYVLRRENSNGTIEVWSTNLSVPAATAGSMTMLQSFPVSTTIGTFTNTWGVDNGHVIVGFYPPGSKDLSGVADFDTATSTTTYWNLGPTTDIMSMVPVWIPGS
ncbi:MAG: hypothetical protein ACLQGT_07710, partial [Terracidiphilus sp.]